MKADPKLSASGKFLAIILDLSLLVITYWFSKGITFLVYPARSTWEVFILVIPIFIFPVLEIASFILYKMSLGGLFMKKVGGTRDYNWLLVILAAPFIMTAISIGIGAAILLLMVRFVSITNSIL